jgi:hypothetical protein
MVIYPNENQGILTIFTREEWNIMDMWLQLD